MHPMVQALLAIFLMLFANLAVTFARTLRRGWGRRLLTFAAVLMLFPAVIFMISVLFF
jgi:hypothetical protein